MSTIQKLTTLVNTFRDERKWRPYHKQYPKDMAVAIITEAAEVLEHFRFKNGEDLDTNIADHKEEIGDELADTLYCILSLASDLDIDMVQALEQKLKKSAKKYPKK